MRRKFFTFSCLMLSIASYAQPQIDLLVGTYTDGRSCGIYSFQFDQLTGKATPRDSLVLKNPSFLTFSADKKLVYAVGETDRKPSLNIVRFDRSNGHLQRLESIPTEGASPCYVSTNGKLALTANYSGGSVSVFELQKNGTKGSLVQQFLGALGGSDPSRQEKPHMHCALFAPDGKFVLATDFSADRICSYRIKDNKLIANGLAAKISAGSGPRHLTFSPNGKFCYLISELSGKVTVFSYRDGRLKELQTVVSDSAEARGAGDIHLSPDGKFLYSSNRLKNDGIAIFAVDENTGKLTPVGYQPTGIHPRHFNITPNGRYLLCACRDSGKIQVFLRDPKTGLLSDTHQDILVDKAVCVQF